MSPAANCARPSQSHGDLRKAGLPEWPLRVLLAIGGIVLATPGGGILPLSQVEIAGLGAVILAPTLTLLSFWCAAAMRRDTAGSTSLNVTPRGSGPADVIRLAADCKRP